MWVGDPNDWATVRHEPRPPLVCPKPGCDVELISYENLNNRHNPRIFKFKSISRSCDHWADRGQGGGPESAQHEWMKLRLTRIAQKLGYTATPEHPPTHSDVFVHEPAFCLEVQLVPTQFSTRTAARYGKGTQVCWLIREGLDTPKARQALFRLPAVRFRIVDQDNPKGRLAAPWDAGGRNLAYRAHLQVFGTIAHAPRPHQRADPTGPQREWFRTGAMDGYRFLQEILSGQRRWYPPKALGHQSGLWALEVDVADYRAYLDQHRMLTSRTPPLIALGPSADSSPAPTASAVLPDDVGGTTFPADTAPPTEPPQVVVHVPQPTPHPADARSTIDTPPADGAAPLRTRRRWWLFGRRR